METCLGVLPLRSCTSQMASPAGLKSKPVPCLRGAACGARTPIDAFMPRLKGTALEARIPFAEVGSSTKGTHASLCNSG